ncbi:hypothetical protein HZF24_16080 [Sedimentibacter hydroxybenzoicus DSM 7310]|uniref:ABC-2 type transport system permease protein n=1 Tax=Sedimentibacter hydroxybenzoicus DSM 7310 TaxID=1123245 RepID=A0A974GXJ6_SEDHY|nr:hypothetical protein [Sedimentibacter hydroxybenzoicus]NYB75667.1 hypothetical protein [Sedimentibacter hydroxybenzoicus DSM 7310]
MNKTWILLRAQIINFFPINEIREPWNKKQNTAVIMGLGVITLMLFICIYNVLTAKILVQVGEQELIPAYMVAISSFAIFFLTMLRSNGILFGSRDIDMLSSLPVEVGEVISSKFLFMYLLNFLVGFVFMVPGGIVWVINAETDILRFALYFASVFFVPLIPMCMASFIGVLVVMVSSCFKNRNILALVFSFAALGLVGYIGISGTHGDSDMVSLGVELAKQITEIYPLSELFLKNFSLLVLEGIGTFIILSSVIFYLFVKIVSKKYDLFNKLFNTSSKYTRYKGVIKRQSSFATLYKKELGRFFSSYTAVLNTGLGVILLCVFSILLLVISPQKLGLYAGIEDMGGFLANYAPIVIASMLSLSCPAASSISLEGKNMWILQSSPVSIKMILNSKLAVNLTLHAFGYFFAVIAVITRLNMSLIQFTGLLIIPVCYSIFIGVLGIFLNKKYPNYEWNSEMVVVKQSIPVIISGIIGMIAVAAPILLNWFLSFHIMPTLWGMAAILIITASIMYQKSCMSNYI